MPENPTLIATAEEIALSLKPFRIETLIIGGAALAAHRYIRFTEDLDLAVNADVDLLREMVHMLRKNGYKAILREPDGDDPLGGVIDIESPAGLIQLISFAGRFPRVVDDALNEDPIYIRKGGCLRLIPLPHLVALKLYAGGMKSKVDVLELLSNNPDCNLDEIKTLCDKYRLKGLTEILEEL